MLYDVNIIIFIWQMENIETPWRAQVEIQERLLDWLQQLFLKQMIYSIPSPVLKTE